MPDSEKCFACDHVTDTKPGRTGVDGQRGWTGLALYSFGGDTEGRRIVNFRIKL